MPPLLPNTGAPRDGLLRAVLAAPADDLPRLVYADWQDEHDRPDHAALIRVRCELARLPGHRHPDRRRALRRRSAELLRRPALRPLAGLSAGRLDRGLPAVDWPVRLTADRLAPPADAPLDLFPGLAVTFAPGIDRAGFAAVAAGGWFGRARRLTFGVGGRLPAGALRPLIGSPAWDLVERIDLLATAVDADDFADLVLAPAGRRLTRVKLFADCRLTSPAGPPGVDAAVARLLRSDRAGRLAELWIDAPALGPASAAAVRDVPAGVRCWSFRKLGRRPGERPV